MVKIVGKNISRESWFALAVPEVDMVRASRLNLGEMGRHGCLVGIWGSDG